MTTLKENNPHIVLYWTLTREDLDMTQNNRYTRHFPDLKDRLHAIGQSEELELQTTIEIRTAYDKVTEYKTPKGRWVDSLHDFYLDLIDVLNNAEEYKDILI